MTNVNGMTDREAAIDAIHRFVYSLDDGDAELLSSAITDDMTMELTSLTKTGLPGQRFEDREPVVRGVMAAVGTSMDNTHMTNNFRVTSEGDAATVTCYALTQHLRKDEGLSTAARHCYSMANRHQARLVRAGKVWRIQSLGLTPAWAQGNVDVMKVH